MKRHTARTLVSLLLLLGSAGMAGGEVKMVRMKIAGYLCGN